VTEIITAMKPLQIQISETVEQNREEYIKFLQELVRIPSLSGEESKVAEYIAEKMMSYGYDIVKVDSQSDVMASIRGSGGGRSILFNGHLDHVPVGDMEEPYSGKIMNGSEFGLNGPVIYGRATSDMKAALSAMVIAGGLLNDMGISLKGDYRVAAVALEELGGKGTKSTIRVGFTGDLVVIGEATNMKLALGHRASTKLQVVVKGRSCHASAPERGVNALYKAIDLINSIRGKLIPKLPVNEMYGAVTLAVTRISVKPDDFNVVPEECRFFIDCRYHPDYSRETLINDLERIIDSLSNDDSEFKAYVVKDTGDLSAQFMGYFTNPKDFPIVRESKDAIAEVHGATPEYITWRFATDGGNYYRLGIPVIGFGPGEERFAHTQQDNVRIRDYLDTIKVYAFLACRICGVYE